MQSQKAAAGTRHASNLGGELHLFMVGSGMALSQASNLGGEPVTTGLTDRTQCVTGLGPQTLFGFHLLSLRTKGLKRDSSDSIGS